MQFDMVYAMCAQDLKLCGTMAASAVQKAHSGGLGREAWTCLANGLEHPSSPLVLQMDTQAASAAMTAVGCSVRLHVYSALFTFSTRPRRLQPKQHNASIEMQANKEGESGSWKLTQLRAVRACARRAYTKCVASGYEPSFPRHLKQPKCEHASRNE